MAEDQDQSQKTEEPTEKKLQDAREKGQVANSKELSNFALLGTVTLLIATAAPYMAENLTSILRRYLADAARLPSEGRALGLEMVELLLSVGAIMAIPFLALAAAGLAAGLSQNGLVYSLEPIKPKLNKISLLAGLKRQFSMKSFVEFIKNIFKITLAGTIGFFAIWPYRSEMLASTRLPSNALPALIGELALTVLALLSAVLAVLAITDFLYQRFAFLKDMRMSKRDIDDEQKNTDGDPKIKQRLRMIRMERARTRMMAEVPKSTVVITNPTHFAVALHYEQSQTPAPTVVAKGMDLVALRIREVAGKAGVPIVENPPLARALYRSVDLGQTIPQEQYQAVAEVISFVYRTKSPNPNRP